jgi:hypothetical protein
MEVNMKRILLAVLSVFFVLGTAFAQEPELQELKKQIADMQKQIDTMNQFVSKNTRHSATDRLSITAEFQTRIDSFQYNDFRTLSPMGSDMMGLWLGDSLVRNEWIDDTYNPFGFNPAFMEKYQMDFMQLMGDMGVDISDPNEMGAAMGNFADMLSDRTLTKEQAQAIVGAFRTMKPKKDDSSNDYMLTNRLRIRLAAKVNEHLSFAGRLTMFKAAGDSTPFHFFNGTMGSMTMDSNSAQVPTDDTLRVERAYFVYQNKIGRVPWHFSFGRRPSAYGPGMENHENAVLGGSPVSSIIQMNFDGASLGFDLSELTNIPGFGIKFCYGQGFEGGYGTLNAMNSAANVDDVQFFGAILTIFDNEDYKLFYNWAHGFGLTDGFIGTAVMPFYVSGMDTNLDGLYDEYTLNPNYGGFVSRVEPTAEVGDIDLHTVMAQGNTFNFSWFVSYALSHTNPDGRSKNAMYQFMGTDEMMDGTGHLVWAGVMTPELPYLKGKLGIEYNHGTKYWQPFIMTYDAQKLTTRGDVIEVYYHQPIVGNNFFITLGYIHYDYKYTNSGNYLGEPVKIKDATAFNTMMPVVDKVDQIYAKMTFRF